MINKFAFLGLGLSLTGCASIIDGTSQQIAFDTNPPGGECELMRHGEKLGTIKTPGSIHIKKTKHDISVKCTKDGYLASTAYLKSQIQDATWGNLILGGGIGWAFDSATGADNKYENHVTVTFVPDNEATRKAEASNTAAKPAPAETKPTADTDAKPSDKDKAEQSVKTDQLSPEPKTTDDTQQASPSPAIPSTEK